MSLPHRRRPCKNCPFRKDSLEGWLGRDRAVEIADCDSFVCHKHNDLQCAGHMLIAKESNLYYRYSLAFKVDLNLKGEDLVFENFEEFIEHQDYVSKAQTR